MSIRTTVTLDDDVVARVKEEAAKKGIPFKEALNEMVRRGTASREIPEAQRNFKIKPLSYEMPRDVNFDNISELLDQLEGEDRR